MNHLKRAKRYVAKKIKRIRRAITRRPRRKQQRSIQDCQQLGRSSTQSCKGGKVSREIILPHEKKMSYNITKDQVKKSLTIVIQLTIKYRSPLHAQVCSRQPTASVPIRMKGAQTVFFNGHLYLGGGHTGSTTNDSIVLRYHPQSTTWEQLPLSPMKWFGMAVFNQQLVLVGGKEIGCKDYKATNKIATWDEHNCCWKLVLPPMTFVRLSPVVYGYKNYLIVAGGEKGSLDYSFEVLDPASKRWMVGPSLPATCSPHTSAIAGRTWYLLQTETDCILSADVQRIIHQTLGLQDYLPESLSQATAKSEMDQSKDCIKEKDPLWKMTIRPHGHLVGMTSLNGDLFLSVKGHGNSKIYIRNAEATHWSSVVSSQNNGVSLLEIVAASL